MSKPFLVSVLALTATLMVFCFLPSLSSVCALISAILLFGFQSYLESDIKTEVKKIYQRMEKDTDAVQKEVRELKNKLEAVNIARMMNR